MALIDEAIQQLPDAVYVTVDIDGLSPELCPGTGTPVPGGLSFGEYAIVLERLVRAGKRVIGFDLVEVCPTDGDREWNASVGPGPLQTLRLRDGEPGGGGDALTLTGKPARRPRGRR
ncbi:MAG: arginase family protein [Phycisphaerales bacterium]